MARLLHPAAVGGRVMGAPGSRWWANGSTFVLALTFGSACASEKSETEAFFTRSNLGEPLAIEAYAYCGDDWRCDHNENIDAWIIDMNTDAYAELVDSHGTEGYAAATIRSSLASQRTASSNMTWLPIGSIGSYADRKYWWLYPEDICDVVRAPNTKEHVLFEQMSIHGVDIPIVPTPGVENATLGWVTCPESTRPAETAWSTASNHVVWIFGYCPEQRECGPHGIVQLDIGTNIGSAEDLQPSYALGSWSRLNRFDPENPVVTFRLEAKDILRDDKGYFYWTLYPEYTCAQAREWGTQPNVSSTTSNAVATVFLTCPEFL